MHYLVSKSPLTPVGYHWKEILRKYLFRVFDLHIDLVESQGSLNISVGDLLKLFHLHFSRCTIYNSSEKNPIHQKSFRPSSFYT